MLILSTKPKLNRYVRFTPLTYVFLALILLDFTFSLTFRLMPLFMFSSFVTLSRYLIHLSHLLFY